MYLFIVCIFILDECVAMFNYVCNEDQIKSYPYSR